MHKDTSARGQMAIDVKEIITNGELEVTGRLVDASNATLFGHVALREQRVDVIYKPIAGERPLWDFPDGTLAGREVAAYRFSEFSELRVVPLTILRDGPFGPGAVQEWIEVPEEIDLIDLAQSHDERLRKLALFDVLVNNTDRKIGHLLPTNSGQLLGCDHGVCFHEEDKLRTVLWQWMGSALSEQEVELLTTVIARFDIFAEDVAEHLTTSEIDATRVRTERTLAEGCFPYPSDEWPAVPWPPI